jgi:eukaryotic-like serine/threonine-protein kinase
VPGAIAAVPGVAGHDPISSFATDTSAATRVLSAGAGAAGAVSGPPTAVTPTPPRRNPWTWPLVAIVSVLAVALIAIIIVLLIRPTGAPSPTASSHSATPSQSKTPTPTPTPTATGSTINPADYVGKPFGQVQDALIQLGYEVDQKQGPAADTPSKNGTVSSLNPTGNVAKGKTIQVFVYQDYPGPSAPSPATAPSGNQHGTITINWSKYAGCPSGFDLTGYVFNASAANGYTFAGSTTNPISPNATSVDITLSSSATSATVTYQASCGSAGLQSPSSSALTIPIG